MDYEKEYKKLKADISNAYLYAQTDSTKAVLENILPELREPEEERIRKKLIWFVENWKKYKPNSPLDDYVIYTSDSDECDKILAWLEKQGQKETDPRYENLEELLAADDIYQMAMNDDMVQEAKTKAINALSELEIGKLLGIEKQGTSYTKRDVDDAYIKGMAFAKDELEKQILANSAKTCKNAWSEVDEHNLNSVINLVHNTRVGAWGSCVGESIEDWLKSLKDRVGCEANCTTTKEWSEEDEQIILSIEQVMNCASLLNIVPEKIDKIRTWLKSLRPQKQWKPSERQVGILQAIVNDPNNAASESCQVALKEIIKQMKKLME